MSFDYDTLVWFSKTFGLVFLVAFFLAVVVYAYWPSNKQTFEDAAKRILDEDDRP